MERSTVRVFHSKANMCPLTLLFTSSNVVLYSPTACMASNLPLSQVNAKLQLLSLGPQTTDDGFKFSINLLAESSLACKRTRISGGRAFAG